MSSCKHGIYERCGVLPLSPCVMFTGETVDGKQAYKLGCPDGETGETYYTEWKLVPPCKKCSDSDEKKKS